MHVTLTLEDDGNWLGIASTRNGEIYSEARPGWSMRDLCRDALARAIAAIRVERRAAGRARAPASTPRASSSTSPTNRQLARALHEQAKRSFTEERYADAIDEWMHAHDLDSRPQFLFNIGNAFRRRGEKSGHLADVRRARDYFLRYIEAERGAEVDPAWMRALDEQIARMERAESHRR